MCIFFNFCFFSVLLLLGAYLIWKATDVIKFQGLSIWLKDAF